MTDVSFDALVLDRPAGARVPRMRGLTLVREIGREAQWHLAFTNRRPHRWAKWLIA